VTASLTRACPRGRQAENGTLRVRDDIAVVGGGAGGADAGLQGHAVLQPGVRTDVHPVPTLGLIAEVARERCVGRALSDLQRVDVVEIGNRIVDTIGTAVY